jgi:hypothetical protein
MSKFVIFKGRLFEAILKIEKTRLKILPVLIRESGIWGSVGDLLVVVIWLHNIMVIATRTKTKQNVDPARRLFELAGYNDPSATKHAKAQ